VFIGNTFEAAFYVGHIFGYYSTVCEACPHRGAELWGLHAIAGLSKKPLAESGREWMSWVGGQPPIEDAHITLTDAPGFGVTIDEASLPLMT